MAAPPYDTIQTILDAARVRLNDAIQTLGGDILKNDAPFTTQVVNNAWRRMQRKLASLGYLKFEDEVIISGLPAVFGAPIPDPSTQVVLSWEGYDNGNGTPDASKALPQSLIEPLDLWEREATTTDTFADMDNILDGLPTVPQGEFLGLWEWRNDAIYMPGCVVDSDLRVRFQSYLADFTSISAAGGPNQVVPIMQCLDPFSLYIAYEMSSARTDVDGPTLLNMAEDACMLMAGRDSAASKGVYKVSELGKMKDGYTPQGAQ